MRMLVSLIAVLVLLFLAFFGTEVLPAAWFFGIVLPYVAAVVFLGGFVWRILDWAKTPVPFRIPTACGQQKSLDWIESAPVENPHTKLGVVVRMLLEVLLFRSLFRNTKTEVRAGRVIHTPTLWLWAGSLTFHACFLAVVLRHFRFFTDPVPLPLVWLSNLDGFLQIGVPAMYMSGVGLLAAAGFLLLRRILLPHVRYISLPADYFPLFLILGIAITGLLLRNVVRTDITAVKQLAMGLVSFRFEALGDIHWLFYGHIFLVCTLLVYFPFSKLMHIGGVFLSPTRNMANNNRMVRHINPWDYAVPVHTYEEYEDEFREKMVKAGIPVDREDPVDKQGEEAE
jgi:nitrate reductase gamma subunit